MLSRLLGHTAGTGMRAQGGGTGQGGERSRCGEPVLQEAWSLATTPDTCLLGTCHTPHRVQ